LGQIATGMRSEPCKVSPRVRCSIAGGAWLRYLVVGSERLLKGYKADLEEGGVDFPSLLICCVTVAAVTAVTAVAARQRLQTRRLPETG
jgi:hypothetical protein